MVERGRRWDRARQRSRPRLPRSTETWRQAARKTRSARALLSCTLGPIYYSCSRLGNRLRARKTRPPPRDHAHLCARVCRRTCDARQGPEQLFLETQSATTERERNPSDAPADLKPDDEASASLRTLLKAAVPRRSASSARPIVLCDAPTGRERECGRTGWRGRAVRDLERSASARGRRRGAVAPVESSKVVGARCRVDEGGAGWMSVRDERRWSVGEGGRRGWRAPRCAAACGLEAPSQRDEQRLAAAVRPLHLLRPRRSALAPSHRSAVPLAPEPSEPHAPSRALRLSPAPPQSRINPPADPRRRIPPPLALAALERAPRRARVARVPRDRAREVRQAGGGGCAEERERVVVVEERGEVGGEARGGEEEGEGAGCCEQEGRG